MRTTHLTLVLSLAGATVTQGWATAAPAVAEQTTVIEVPPSAEPETPTTAYPRTRLVSWIGLALGVAAIGAGALYFHLDGRETNCTTAPAGNRVCFDVFATQPLAWAAMAAGATLATSSGYSLLTFRW
ncbi:MAG: hypothetical protein SFX73_08595 [Kofleriaceae bacterium]|nr:hypothetical protein [Kofleriaceae bacterium]